MKGLTYLKVNIILFMFLSLMVSLSACNSQVAQCNNSPNCHIDQTNGNPPSNTNNISSSSDTNTPPQSNTGQPCTGYFPTGKGITTNIQNVSVPSNCVMIIDSYAGNIGGLTWNAGGVIALGPGTYSGTLTDGEWLIVNTSIARGKFCEKINQLESNGQANSLHHPLDGANWPSC